MTIIMVKMMIIIIITELKIMMYMQDKGKPTFNTYEGKTAQNVNGVCGFILSWEKELIIAVMAVIFIELILIVMWLI